MERYNRSVWKDTAGKYGKVQQVSMERYSVWKGTAGQYEKVLSMERYNRSVW